MRDVITLIFIVLTVRFFLKTQFQVPFTPGEGGGYSHILAIQGCTTGKGMVFKPFGLV